MDFFHHPAADAPLLVDTADKLQEAIQLFHGATVVGIDCEWPPEETGHSPSATVLQLAVWCPESGLHALILDLLGLDATTTADFLQHHIFRKEAILKIGYSLRADVSALKTRLGISCVSIIDPIIDVGILHRRLCHLRCAGVHPSASGGLSGLIHAHLGAPLDKSQQCSEWGHRPLTQAQLRYGANDACCLLALLCYLMLCSRDQDQSPSAPQDHIIPNNGAKKEDILPEDAYRIAIGPSNEWWKGAEVHTAAQVWGERWETSGKGGKILRSRGLSHVTYADGFSKTEPEVPDFPAHVPWMDSARTITSSPLFLADVMLMGLARQLRLWGFDAEAMESVPKMERHAVQRRLVERAVDEGRVLLTRDAIFMRRGLSDQAYFVKAEAKKEQLEEVISTFGLPVTQEILLSRCARCNGEFGQTAVAGKDLPPGHGVPPGVVERVVEFWVCDRCNAAYWQGNMYDRAMERLGAAMESLHVASSGRQRRQEAVAGFGGSR